MLIGKCDSPEAHAVLNRTREDWINIIMDFTTQLDKRILPDEFIRENTEILKLRAMSLLRQVRRASTGGTSDERDLLAITTLTLKDISILCGWIFAVKAPIPQRFGECDPYKLRRTLSKSKLFTDSPSLSQVEQWCRMVKTCLPIEQPEWTKELEPILGDECTIKDWAYLREWLLVP